jgi:hypothetical protein
MDDRINRGALKGFLKCVRKLEKGQKKETIDTNNEMCYIVVKLNGSEHKVYVRLHPLNSYIHNVIDQENTMLEDE